jgi:hypothetical protein
MNLVRLVEAAAVAGILSTFTDWLLAGDWLQSRLGSQDVWRKTGGILSVLISTALPFITCGAFALLAYKLQIIGLRNSVKLGLAIWVIGPLPLAVSNTLFFKLHRVYAALYATAWLVKLMIAAVVFAKFVH